MPFTIFMIVAVGLLATYAQEGNSEFLGMEFFHLRLHVSLVL